MRFQLLSVGEYNFFDEPANNGGLIGGKVIAINPETGEEVSRMYKKFHTGKTNKYDVMAKLIMELIPPEEESITEDDSSEN